MFETRGLTPVRWPVSGSMVLGGRRPPTRNRDSVAQRTLSRHPRPAYNAIMSPDEEVCYCFHVSMRKLVHYARRERPCRASQLSNCLDAGTGCGWCIPVLKRIHEQVESGQELPDDGTIPPLPQSSEEYAQARREYLESDKKHSLLTGNWPDRMRRQSVAAPSPHKPALLVYATSITARKRGHLLR